jgi:hypothetical protein
MRIGRCILALAAFVLATAVLARALHATVPHENVGPDFIQFYTAASLIVAGEDPYGPAEQAAVQRRLGWNKAEEGLGLYDFMPFYYPPWLALAVAALLPLGYPLAKMTFIVLSAEALVGAALLLRSVAGGLSTAMAVAVVALFGFSIKAALMGQIAPLVLVLAALAWWLLERHRDVAAGAVVALLSIKPQLTLLAIVAVLVWSARQQRWPVVAGFLATLAVLVATSTVAFPAWLPSMLAATDVTPMPTRYFPGIGATLYSVLDALGIHGMALVVAASVAGAVAIVALLEAALRRTTTLAELFAAGFLAPFFVVPYARAYDFPVLLVPALALLGARISPLTRMMLAASLTVVAGLHILAVTTNWEPAVIGVRRQEFTYFWIPVLLALAWAVVPRPEAQSTEQADARVAPAA